jgi:hypothetical protein
MKKYLFLFLIALFTTSATAQDAMPTKEETVNYINKKMQEVLGLDPYGGSSSGSPQQYKQLWFKMSGANVEVGITEGAAAGYGSSGHTVTYLFNPRHIKDVVVGKPSKGNSTARVGINFYKGTLREGPTLRVIAHEVPFVNIPYLTTLPGNAEKIAKAILHLRDLAKAEDELF